MSNTRQFLKVSGILFALILLTSASQAFAEIEPVAPVDTFATDTGLGLHDSADIQDLDQNLNTDPQQLSNVMSDQIRTTQAMHAEDEEVSEPIADGY